MSDLELITAAKERCLKRRLYDYANFCLACEYKIKNNKELTNEDRLTLWKFVKMRPKAPETFAQIGYAKYRTRKEEND